MNQVDVVGLGYVSVDYLCQVAKFPAEDSKAEAICSVMQGGGQVATALVALSRWGIDTAYVGTVGDDENGKFSKRELIKERVDTVGLFEISGVSTQFALIIVSQNSGSRTILWKRGEALNLKPSFLKKSLIQRGKILHVDGHEIDAALQAAYFANECGMKVVFDAEKVFSKTEELIGLTHSLVTSSAFPEKFTGISDIKKALIKLKSYGPKYVVTTLGENGAIGYDGEDFFEILAISVPIVDTTGAGDLFHSGYIYGLLKGFTFKKCIQFANIAAGLKCRSLGGRAGIPRLEEIERMDFT